MTMITLPTLQELREACQLKNPIKARGYFQVLLQTILAVEPLTTTTTTTTTTTPLDAAVDSTTAAKTAATTTTKTTMTKTPPEQAKDLILEIQDLLSEKPQIKDALLDVIWFETTLIASSEITAPPPPTDTEETEAKALYPQTLVDLLTSLSSFSSLSLGQAWLELLDPTLLQALGVIASEAELQKKVRHANTKLHYQQHKFNIMSEESEGFAKYLHTVSILLNKKQELRVNDDGDDDDDYYYHKGNTALLQLIATFSLDPCRCLDILLDILEMELIAEAKNDNNNNNNHLTQLLPKDTVRIRRLVKLIQPLAARLGKLSTLLAFRLQQQQRKQEQVRQTPLRSEQVLRMAAYLAKMQILDLADFLTFLPEWPKEVQSLYQAVRKQERDLIRSMGRVRLASNTTTTTNNNNNNKADDDNDKNKRRVDLSTLRDHPTTHLLTMMLVSFNQHMDDNSHNDDNRTDCAAIVEKLFKPYWSMLCFLFPQTFGVMICDQVEARLDPIYKRVYESGNGVPWTETASVASVACLKDNEEAKGKGGEDENNSSNDKDNKVSDMDAFLSAVAEKLEYTRESGCIVLRPVLYSKICRTLNAILEKEQHPLEKCVEFLRNFLLPSSSLFENHPAVAQQVWNILERFPYVTRYSFYSTWKGSGLERDALLSDKPLWLIRGEVVAGKEARSALKRLSKDTIREFCRALAKVSHAHPLVVFSTILSQIESYDNLVQIMVDALRFVTPLSLDVLGFCIMGRLDGSAGGVNRSRLKDDGVNVSQWLQSLESFIGALYKHFPFLELGGIMSYLMGRVTAGHVMELGVLRTLLKESGGWAFADYAPAASLSSTQIEGRAGSTLLVRETMSFGVVPKMNENASATLRRVLLNDEVGVKLLILLSQIPHQIIFDTKSKPRKPVKLIANLVDTCQVTTAILLGFLSAGVSTDIARFAKCLPTLAALHNEYELDVASAWMLARPLIRAAASSDNAASDTGIAAFKLTELSRNSYSSMFPEAFWAHLSIDLFETFYMGTLYDVSCPEELYKTEIERLSSAEERLERQKASAMAQQTAAPGGGHNEFDDAAAAKLAKKNAGVLASDLTEHKKHIASYRQSLVPKSRGFFVPQKDIKEAAVLFFAHCIYPRCMQGPDDALYCARFSMLLHNLEVTGFSTMHLFDILIVASSRCLFGLTEGEAASVSIMLKEIWKTVSRWRYDEEAFKNELSGKPGSNMVGDDGDVAPISKERFTELYNKWHAAIGSTALGCLQSKEYIHARNALIVLTRMVDVYPTRPRLANKLLADLQPMQDEAFPFADLRASAQSYSMQLLKARDDGAWKEESAKAIKARLAQEQAAAAARQKKAKEQMEQIRLDSEKITEEIGEKDVYTRDRRGPYRGGPDEGRRTQGSGPSSDSKGAHLSTPSKDRGVGGGESWNQRERRDWAGSGRNDPSASVPSGARAGDDARRGGGDGRPKRSRPPSPADPGEIQEDTSALRNKRQRYEGDDDGRKGGYRGVTGTRRGKR